MPAMIAMGALSLIGGIAGRKSAQKDRRYALKLQADTLEFNKKRYDDYKSLYGDLEAQLVADAKKGVVADTQGVTTRAVGDVAKQFSGAEQAAVRNMQRYGINPNSGRAESTMRQTGLSKAIATAGLVNQQREAERRSAEEQTWNRRASVTNLGVSQMNNAAGGVNNSMGAMADTYNSSASEKAAEASQLFGAAGMMMGFGLGRGAGAGDGGAGGGVKAPQAVSVDPVDNLPAAPAWGIGRERPEFAVAAA